MATTNKRTGVNDEEDMNPNEELELSFLLLAIVFPDFDSDLKTHTSKTKINPRSWQSNKERLNDKLTDYDSSLIQGLSSVSFENLGKLKYDITSLG